ncbi:hypothetical protein F9954_09800, partial [Bacteroides stercoris]
MSVIKIEDTKQVFLQIILTSKSSVPYMELRDKLFTEEQYIKQLAKYYCRIEKLNSMIEQSEYLQPIITQYFIDNKSEIWLLFLIAH